MALNLPKGMTVSQIMFQLAGVLLTLVGVSFTVTQPLFQRIDALNASVIELKVRDTTQQADTDRLEGRLTRIETDLYRLRQEYGTKP